MKAGTVFAITVAILLGLGVVVVGKVTGIFDKKPEPPKPPDIMVLVASQNLYEGMALRSTDVQLRALHPHELAHYEKNRDKYLPPVKQAAELRILTRHLEAGTPLLREHLEDQGLPESVSSRLKEGYRAITVAAPKDRCAGGLLRVGERVDVYLTTEVACEGETCTTSTTRTAMIARDVEIIIKKNALWPVIHTLPDDQPVTFTLAANPYRVALLEYARDKGHFSLVPTTVSRQAKTLTTTGPVFSDPKSKEFKDEDLRIEHVLNGDLVVGDADLARIFNLKAPPSPPSPLVIQRYSGVQQQPPMVFGGNGYSGTNKKPEGSSFVSIDADTAGAPSVFRFRTPGLAAATSASKGG